MGTQNVDYAEVGATLDTGETDTAAIRPVLDTEPAIAATFNRPTENLRHRSEVLRTEVENSKYLEDADRVLTIQGGGNLLWNGIVAGGGDGKFTISSDLTIRPFLAPATCTRAKAIIRGIVFETVLTGSPVPRAYNGANKFSIQITGSNGATLAVAHSGSPDDDIVLTVDTNATTGTTKTDVVNFLTAGVGAGPVAYRALGLTAVLDAGTVGSDKVSIDGPFTGADTKQFAGATDAERHVITPAGLVTFFGDALNVMAEGDVVGLWYDKLVNGSFGGRRESIPDAPESSSNADANLFLLRRFPERLPFAIPVALVANDQLRLLDGTISTKGNTTTLGAGFVHKTGDTMSGDLVMNAANVTPQADNTGKVGTSALRFSELNAALGNIKDLKSTTGGVLGSSSVVAARYSCHIADIMAYGASGIRPSTTGGALGDSTHRFTSHFENVTVYGTTGIVPSATGKLIGNAGARFTAHIEDMTIYNSSLPSATGKSLGDSGHRWNMNGTALDLSLTARMAGLDFTPVSPASLAGANPQIIANGTSFQRISLGATASGTIGLTFAGIDDGQILVLVFVSVNGGSTAILATASSGSISQHCAGTFTPTASDTITFIFDGATSSWYEVSRSVNG